MSSWDIEKMKEDLVNLSKSAGRFLKGVSKLWLPGVIPSAAAHRYFMKVEELPLEEALLDPFFYITFILDSAMFGLGIFVGYSVLKDRYRVEEGEKAQ